MAITIDAVYENGVFKPDRPVELNERARVRLTLVESQVAADDDLPPLDPNDPLDAVIGIGSGPRDGADNHDHYIYGHEKRTGE